jgi:PAS domain S-box-containing protein
VPGMGGITLEEMFLAAEASTEHIVITDAEGVIKYANKAAERVTGFTASEMLGQTPRLWGRQMDGEFYGKMWKTIRVDKKPFEAELTNKKKDGRLYFAKIKIAPYLDSEGNLLGYVANEDDITAEKEVEKIKTEFVSLASHQLRTPLTSIRWNLELLNARVKNMPPEGKELTDSAYEATLRMVDLVNGLLNITRVESGRVGVKPEKVDLREIVEKLIGDLEPQVEAKKQQMVIVGVGEVPAIDADRKLVTNVYLSLLSNAVKYTPPEKKIEVRFEVKDNEIVSLIRDEGVGIPESEKSRVFEKFFRASNAISESAEGSGLGLYLAKLLVKLMGGEIWFESVENGGSTFGFSLPRSGVMAKKGEIGLE